MTYIRWDDVFYFDPSTGESVPVGTAGALPFVAYGNYGGAGYSAGEFGGALPTKTEGAAYTYEELLTAPDDDQKPVDFLDFLFYVHDVDSLPVGDGYTHDQADADATLLGSLVEFDASFDPEASLYAGFAALGMVARLGVNNQLDIVPPILLFSALDDAVGDIQFGLENLPQAELTQALNTFFEPTDDPAVSAFDFSVTTISVRQEIYELFAVNAANAALDFGESDDTPVQTGFFVPGSSDYRLAFNSTTADLDLLSI